MDVMNISRFIIFCFVCCYDVTDGKYRAYKGVALCDKDEMLVFWMKCWSFYKFSKKSNLT